nr:rpb7-binding protein seb1 [Quercus suber]
MAGNILTDLDSQLASLNQLKPPGASKGKINSITQLCINNVQTESGIVQSLYRAMKKAPATHKLGALYVIDSVVRQWIDKAKQNGQPLNFEGRGEPGTYSAGVKRVTELMPALFDDILKALPAEQKPKLENIIGIWEKGSTFPVKLLADFKARLSNDSAPTNGTSDAQYLVKPQAGGKFTAPIPSRPLYTPVGYPPQSLREQGLTASSGEQNVHNTAFVPPSAQPQHSAPPSQKVSAHSDVNSILAALADAAPKPVAPTAAPPPPMPNMQQLPPELAALFNQQNGFQARAEPPQPPPQAPGFSAVPMPSSVPPSMPYGGYPSQSAQQFNGYPPQPPPSIPQAYAAAAPPPQQTSAADLLGPLRGILPQNIINDPDKLVRALSLLQDLQKQGLPMDQWGPVLQAFDRDASSSHATTSIDHVGHDRYGNRERSKSPDRHGRGRGSPVYGSYEEVRQGANERGNYGNADGGRSRYRQRSPMGMHNSPGGAMGGGMQQPKIIEYDYSLPPDHIKVLSRTLFVGGANGSQSEIHQLFERFGRVQTCIANQQKRHAFVKMTTREYALAARAGMEELQNRNDREAMALARQTKWGVGFGPRECCDYQRGESVIPIHKLTDADVKWLLTAEYGGTGGKPPEGGMVIEEPDIEIGAGVSSKAMSKRVLPDTGPPTANKRPKDNKHKGKYEHRHHDRDRESSGFSGYTGVPPTAAPQHMEAYGYPRPEPVVVATPPAVPTFGFSLPSMNGSTGAYRQ